MNTKRIVHLTGAAGVLLAGATGALAQGAAPPPPTGWETLASLGFTVTRGNSSTLLFQGKVLGNKKWDRNELNLGADVTYGENKGTRNADAYHGFGQYNRLLANDRVYAYGRMDALRDRIAAVNYRLTISGGAGYYFIKDDRTFLRAEVGPGVVFENQGGKSTSYVTLRAGERFEHKFNATTKMWQSLEFLPQLDRLKNWIANFEIGLDTALTKKLSLQTYAQDSYDHEPAPGRKKNDLKFVTALAYKF